MELMKYIESESILIRSI